MIVECYGYPVMHLAAGLGPMLTMNLWHPGAINYELTVSSDDAAVNTLEIVGRTGVVRSDGEL